MFGFTTYFETKPTQLQMTKFVHKSNKKSPQMMVMGVNIHQDYLPRWPMNCEKLNLTMVKNVPINSFFYSLNPKDAMSPTVT